MFMDNQNAWWKNSLLYFSKLSSWIILPIVFALVVGKYLDNHFKTGQLIFYISLGCGFVLSMIGLLKEARVYMKEISQANDTPSHASDEHVEENNTRE